MPFSIDSLNPLLKIEGEEQKFTYDPLQQNSTFTLLNNFTPTPSVPSNIKLDMLNSSSNGYRIGTLSPLGQTTPTWLLSSVSPSPQGINSDSLSTPLLTYNEGDNNEFNFYAPPNVPSPTMPSHSAPKGYVDNIFSDAATKEYVNDKFEEAATKEYVDNKFDPLDMNNKSIKNLATPIDPSDAATKWYVDDTFDNAATRQYVDDKFNPLNMDNKQIVNLATPVNTNDAATKAYVDAQLSAAQYGTFFPEITDEYGTLVPGSSSSNRVGRYVKIGNIVFMYVYYRFSSSPSGPTHILHYTGLPPFTPMSNSRISFAHSNFGDCTYTNLYMNLGSQSSVVPIKAVNGGRLEFDCYKDWIRGTSTLSTTTVLTINSFYMTNS